MRKKFLFIATALIVISWSLHAQPVQQKISEKVTVTFPGKPEKDAAAETSGMMLFGYKQDSTKGYMAISFDLGKMGITAEMLQSMSDMIWEQSKPKLVSQLGKEMEVVKDEKVKLKGIDAHYIEVKSADSSSKIKNGFFYFFFTDAILNFIGFGSTSDKAKADDAKAFFDSISIDK